MNYFWKCLIKKKWYIDQIQPKFEKFEKIMGINFASEIYLKKQNIF